MALLSILSSPSASTFWNSARPMEPATSRMPSRSSSVSPNFPGATSGRFRDTVLRWWQLDLPLSESPGAVRDYSGQDLGVRPDDTDLDHRGPADRLVHGPRDHQSDDVWPVLGDRRVPRPAGAAGLHGHRPRDRHDQGLARHGVVGEFAGHHRDDISRRPLYPCREHALRQGPGGWAQQRHVVRPLDLPLGRTGPGRFEIPRPRSAGPARRRATRPSHAPARATGPGARSRTGGTRRRGGIPRSTSKAAAWSS